MLNSFHRNFVQNVQSKKGISFQYILGNIFCPLSFPVLVEGGGRVREL